MRIIFYNPQSSPVIGVTLYNKIFGIFSYNKYQFLLKNKPSFQHKLIFFIDSNGTSLLPKWLGKIMRPRLELFIWLLINRINPINTITLTNVKQINKDDVLIGFSVGLLDSFNSDLKNLSKIKCTKIFHLTHFIQNTNLISKNSKRIKVDYFIAENNLYKNSPYFRKHFAWYKKNVYTLPFAFQNRFFSKKLFLKRKNKAMAIGTVVDVSTTQSINKFKDFILFFKTTIIQPMRYKIYLSNNKINKHIDSFIGELYETKLKTKSNNVIKRILNAFSDATKATKRKYFTFNMVDMFNKYKMFVNGEEINNLPGIGFVEGIACGCVYFGHADPMYTDLGFIPNEHFVAYNGTLSDLIKKIQFYQKHSKKLFTISNNGSNFVRKFFSGLSIANIFYEDIYKFSMLKKMENNQTYLKCSFIKK